MSLGLRRRHLLATIAIGTLMSEAQAQPADLENTLYMDTKDGRVTIRGRYSAKWRRTDGVWLLEAEVFTPLSCRGSSYCTRPPAQP